MQTGNYRRKNVINIYKSAAALTKASKYELYTKEIIQNFDIVIIVTF